MSRSILWILTAFLSLAMIALVAIQTYWIRHSIRTEEKQLRMVVSQVLANVSEELAEDETGINILEEFQPPIVQHRSQAFWNLRIDARSTYGGDTSESYQMNEEFYFSAPPESPLKNQKVEQINDSTLVIVGEDELLRDTILVSELNSGVVKSELEKYWDQQEQFLDRIVRRMMAEPEGLEEKFSASHVEQLLKTKLEEKGVDMPFEYAVYYEGEKPIFQSEKFNEFEEVNYIRTQLFPGGFFHKPSFISVYFPNEKAHIRSSMRVIAGSSLLITLLIIMLFTLALFVIFKQKRLSDIKNDFVNNMTHELKTPISTISLASQMLSDRSIPVEQKNLGQISRIIQAESKQLGYQVERVLQMAIFDHGQLKLKLQELDLHEIIETVAQNFLIQVDKRGGKMEFLPEADNAVITGDSMHITNVISNLIENAMKYTRRTPEITIATRNEEDQVVISVIDNGIGISREDQKRVFDKFYRVPTGNVHNVKGFGLGLSYVKLIVEEHGGSIQLKSEPEKGSRFDIRLPLYKE